MISFSNSLFSHPSNQRLVRQALLDIQMYWEANIDKHFSKSSNYVTNVGDGGIRVNKNASHKSGRLKQSCYVEHIDGTNVIYVGMKKVINPKTGKDYGRYLRDGTPDSAGQYQPWLDARLATGVTKGFDNSAWESWDKEFYAYVRARIKQLIYEAAGNMGDVMVGRM